jgi:hypothetical protein
MLMKPARVARRDEPARGKRIGAIEWNCTPFPPAG